MSSEKKKNAIVDVSGGLAQFQVKLAGHAPYGLGVAFFWAEWAAQCRPMDEALAILVEDESLASVLFLRVEAEEEADVSMEYEVAAVPTFLFFRTGSRPKPKLLERIEGAKVADVTKKVRKALSTL